MYGRNKYLIDERKIIIIVQCDKYYEDHDYCIEELIIKKKRKKNF